MRIPYATRSLRTVYVTVGKVIANDKYLDMTESEFTRTCLQECGGNVNPLMFRQIYFDLMKDAGLSALNSPMKANAEDNGDHSWEYYVAGRFVKEEEYNQTAHSSYFAT